MGAAHWRLTCRVKALLSFGSSSCISLRNRCSAGIRGQRKGGRARCTVAAGQEAGGRQLRAVAGWESRSSRARWPAVYPPAYIPRRVSGHAHSRRESCVSSRAPLPEKQDAARLLLVLGLVVEQVRFLPVPAGEHGKPARAGEAGSAAAGPARREHADSPGEGAGARPIGADSSGRPRAAAGGRQCHRPLVPPAQ